MRKEHSAAADILPNTSENDEDETVFSERSLGSMPSSDRFFDPATLRKLPESRAMAPGACNFRRSCPKIHKLTGTISQFSLLFHLDHSNPRILAMVIESARCAGRNVYQ
jgi:hypothetical protein